MFPRRGEIYWVNLDPTVGSEIRKVRPAIILSNNVANEFSSRVIVAPITSQVKKVYPFEVAIQVGSKSGKVLLDQLRAIDKQRLGRKVEMCDLSILDALDKALKLVLEL